VPISDRHRRSEGGWGRLSSGQIALRTTLCLLLISWSLVACTGGVVPNPNPNPGGPPFVINSPLDGGQIAGTVFFSAQPFDASSVRRVEFRAGDTDLGSDNSAPDGFRVFLDSTDFLAGPLELTATAVGTNGRRTVHTVTAENIPAPPSTATTTDEGAVLGAAETNGGVSTLTVPVGAPEGVGVTFDALDEAEVLARTGVDYDALGVTFLGAQGIEADGELGTAIGITSGGFGPMVQPGQAVVNYGIGPDADGDGVGELTVINTATVTPGGDVISDPVELVQLGSDAIVTNRSGSRLHTLQQGLSGPPGTRLSIEVQGLAPVSNFGNLAMWTSGVDGEVSVFPGTILLDAGDPDLQRFSTVIPPLSAGPAELVIVSAASGFASDPVVIDIEPASVPAAGAQATIDALLDGTATYLAGLEPASTVDEERFAAAAVAIAAVKADLASLDSLDMEPDEAALVAQMLDDLAIMIDNSGVLVDLASGPSLRTQYQNFGAFADDAMGLFGGLAALVSAGAAAIGAITAGSVVAAVLLSMAATILLIYGTVRTVYYLCKIIGGGYCGPNPNPPCIIVPGTPPPIIAPGTPPAPPEGIRRQQGDPSAIMTGMGSLVPPGGDACGTAVADGDNAAVSLRTTSVGGPVEAAFGDLTGRFVVKVFYGSGNSVPFSGISDASGYFYLPSIPAGQPFEAIAYDTLTSETRSFEGVGAEVGDSTYLFFDFFSEGAAGGDVLAYDSNAEGEHGDVDLYLFEGQAGDLINIAVFSEEENLNGISYQLSDPNGVQLISGLTTGGHRFDLASPVPIALESDGLYAFSLDGSEVSGAYTLGLSLLSPPETVVAGIPVLGDMTALGDRHYYQLTGAVDDLLGVTLSHEVDSTLEADLKVLRPDDLLLFYQRPLLFRLVTDEVQRSRSNDRTLEQDGSYVIEVRLADLFSDVIDPHLGTYQLDVTLDTP
jgi:hypothetical protein